MKFRNPTRIQVGMTGTFEGRSYKVAGRVVMGMDDGGQTYYWNEFNLVADTGENATLVFEETDRGPQWRIFTMFDPEYPITADDAATKRVGDPLNLDGTDVRVTLVDSSRVYHIEGEAPEGVEVGDVANYFNAEARNTMIVVSWTGNEVECYHGVDIRRSLVQSAFRLGNDLLPRSSSRGGLFAVSSSASGSSSGNYDSLAAFLIKACLVVIVAAVMISFDSSCRISRRPGIVRKVAATASPLAPGSEGTLDGRHWHIREHAMVEIAEVGRIFDRHEYQLSDDAGNRALLIRGSSPRVGDWMLFTPLELVEPPTPQQEGTLRYGDTVNLNGYVGTITELFQVKFESIDREGLQWPDAKTGDVYYGFIAKSGSATLMVRWKENAISFYTGREITGDIPVAFGKQPKN